MTKREASKWLRIDMLRYATEIFETADNYEGDALAADLRQLRTIAARLSEFGERGLK